MRVREIIVLVSILAGQALAVPPDGTARTPMLRVQVVQPGDFMIIGNTLGWDCGAGGAPPVAGTIGACGANVMDSALDVLWRSDDAAGTALADIGITLAEARSSAVLDLPPDAVATHAFLYWAGMKTGTPADDQILLERPDGAGGTEFGVTIDADDWDGFWAAPYLLYQSSTDVTDLVRQYGNGAYRVSGVEVDSPVDLDDERLFAAWALVVLYESPNEPLRHLEIRDGLDVVDVGNAAAANLSGFLVPAAGLDAKLGVLAYEGDDARTGDEVRFGVAPLSAGDALSDALNPSNNFFNGTHAILGAGAPAVGDLPRLTGGASSMAGVDIDVVDVSAYMSPGQTSADVEVTTLDDLVLLGALVFSTTHHAPHLEDAAKQVTDLDGGFVLAGDVLRYTIQVANGGNDTAIDVVLDDVLPAQVDYVPGSLVVLSGANAGPKTDQPGDDQGEYDEPSHTITFRLGAGADAVSGGTLSVSDATAVEFDVLVQDGVLGWVSNQGTLSFAGEHGHPPDAVVTDGDAETPGDQPTDIEVVSPPSAELTPSLSSHDFGDQFVGVESAVLRFTVTNTGDLAATAVSCAVVPRPPYGAPEAAAFVLQTSCPPTLPVAETIDVQLTFTPDEQGPFGATVEFLYFDGNAMTTLDVDVDGTGILDPYPRVSSIVDVPNDQGRQVSMTWSRSGYDQPGGPAAITSYALYRRIDDDLAAARETGRPEESPRRAYPPGDWHYLMSVPARMETSYAAVLPTLADSTVADGMYYTTFFVSAMTATPGLFYDSEHDSGYSLDNLAPSVPTGLLLAGGVLSWDDPTDADFDYFSVFGSDVPELDQTAELIGHTTGTDMTIPGPGQAYLLVTATDFAGNAGDAAVVDAVTAIASLPRAYELLGNSPNPFNPRTSIAFALPGRSTVRLRVFDVSGGLVRVLLDGEELEAGRHERVWDGRDGAGRPVASGTYFSRLDSGGYCGTRRMALIR